MLDARAIALQGIGYEPRAVATQGFTEIVLVVFKGTGGGASAGVGSYEKNRTTLFEEELWSRDQIIQQDEEVLFVIMLSVVRGDVL